MQEPGRVFRIGEKQCLDPVFFQKGSFRFCNTEIAETPDLCGAYRSDAFGLFQAGAFRFKDGGSRPEFVDENAGLYGADLWHLCQGNAVNQFAGQVIFAAN